MYYFLLDEIQMLDSFVAVLNSYLRKDNIDVYVTGSNAKLLSKDIATEFAGRGDEVHMYPLSFSEFMSVYQGDKYMGLTDYMLYGGIPSIVLKKDNIDKEQTLKNLFTEIYIQDIVRRNRVKNIGELVKKGLPKTVQQALDVVRVVGNKAVHPGQIAFDVDDKNTATMLMRLLNIIVERMITEPKEIDSLYQGLPESVRNAIENRDKKLVSG